MATEDRNPATLQIDTLDAAGICALLHAEDAAAFTAVGRVLPAVARAAAAAAGALAAGGRLLYAGAGTSGRLCVLDASELPPTFGLDPARARALLAGGSAAMTAAVEGAEDDRSRGTADVAAAAPAPPDLLLAVAASGRTPYVLAAAAEARRRGATTVGVLCNPGAPLEAAVDIAVVPDTGAEALLGSTRMKAATAQMMVLRMISTAALVLDGHVYSNLLVDMRPSNRKLEERAARMIALATGCRSEEAADALAAAGGEVKTAIALRVLGVPAAEARRRLAAAGGRLRGVIP